MILRTKLTDLYFSFLDSIPLLTYDDLKDGGIFSHCFSFYKCNQCSWSPVFCSSSVHCCFINIYVLYFSDKIFRTTGNLVLCFISTSLKSFSTSSLVSWCWCISHKRFMCASFVQLNNDTRFCRWLVKLKRKGHTKTACSEERSKAPDTWTLRVNRIGLISNQVDGF